MKSRSGLQTKARNLGLSVSRLRTIDQLEQRTRKKKARGSQACSATKKTAAQRPIPAPRRKKLLIDEPVPEITAQILVPKEVPLRPPRTKKSFKVAAKQTIETFPSWLDLLKNTGQTKRREKKLIQSLRT